MITFLAVGDIMINGKYFVHRRRLEETKKKPLLKRPRFSVDMKEHARKNNSELILSWLKGADITFANLETTLARGGFPLGGHFIFRADPTNADDLRSLGFNVVSLANNHMFNYGCEGVIETLQALDTYGINHVGAGRDSEEAFVPIILDINDKKIGFLAFATSYPPYANAAFKKPGIAGIRTTFSLEFGSSLYLRAPKVKRCLVDEDVNKVQDCIRRLKEKSDFVIVSIHWGEEYEYNTADYQQTLGHSMIDAGADLIVGHHPHTLQPIEVYKGKYIFYSLGNFVFQEEEEFMRSELLLTEAFILRATVEGVSISKIELLPTRIDKTGLPLITEAKEKVIEHLNKISSPLGVNVIPYEKWAIVQEVKI